MLGTDKVGLGNDVPVPKAMDHAFVASLRKTALMLEGCLEAHQSLFEARFLAKPSDSIAAHAMRHRLRKLRLTIAKIESGQTARY